MDSPHRKALPRWQVSAPRWPRRRNGPTRRSLRHPSSGLLCHPRSCATAPTAPIGRIVKPIADPEIAGNVLIVLIVHLLRIVETVTARDRKADRPGIAVRMARANPVKDVASTV